MRSEIQREIIPPDPEPTILETEWFVCDECEFRDQEEEAVERHFAQKHAVRAKLQVGGKNLYRFNSEADAEAWLKIESGNWHQVQDLKWTEPGWYTTETWSQPCPRGCCTDQCIRLVSINVWLEEQVSQVRDIMSEIKDIRCAIKREADDGS